MGYGKVILINGEFKENNKLFVNIINNLEHSLYEYLHCFNTNNMDDISNLSKLYMIYDNSTWCLTHSSHQIMQCK